MTEGQERPDTSLVRSRAHLGGGAQAGEPGGDVIRFELLGRAVVALFILILVAVTFIASSSDVERARQALEDGKIDQAIELLDPLVVEGDPRAKVLLGDLYRDGQGFDQDRKQALSLYLDAATSRNREALGRLVSFHRDGGTDTQDLTEARKWLFILHAQVNDQWVVEDATVFQLATDLDAQLAPDQIEEARRRADA